MHPLYDVCIYDIESIYDVCIYDIESIYDVCIYDMNILNLCLCFLFMLMQPFAIHGIFLFLLAFIFGGC